MPDYQQFRRFAPDVVSLGVGTAIFFVFYGTSFLLGAAPYITTPIGDIAAEMGGYYHFANDAWHFPLFVMPDINKPEGSNVLFTGGVPLLALVAKIVHSVSGRTPDLFGPWYLLCCALQTHALYFLMRQITDARPLLLSLASLIGGLTYAFLTRNGHVSLFCHFFCIYAVAFVIATTNDKFRPSTILLALAGLVYASMFVFAYLAICNTFMFMAALGSLYQQRKLRLGQSVVAAVAFGVALLLLAYVGGYFWAVGKAAPASLSGFSVYGFNIGSLFDPPKSVLFPDKPFLRAWWEGDFYLGMGIIALWLILLISDPLGFARLLRRHWAMAAALGVLTLYSISTRVSFLDWVLIDIPPPQFLTPVLGMARTAGRLFWPIGYLLIGGAIALTVARFRRAGPALVAAAMLIAVLESTSSYAFIRGSTTTVHPTPLSYAQLQAVMDTHTSLVVYPSLWCSPSHAEPILIVYQQLELTSGRAGLPSNTTMTARQIKDCSAERARAKGTELHPGELLVLMNRITAKQALQGDRRDELLRHCRTFRIDKDDALMCSASWTPPSDDRLRVPSATAVDSPLGLDGRIDFASGSNRDWFVLSGWSSPEPEFSWTVGSAARLEFKLPPMPSDRLAAEVTVYPYLRPPGKAPRDTKVLIDDTVVATWSFSAEGWQTRRLALPAGLDGRNVQVTFRQDDARDPADVQPGEPRDLGIAVKKLTLVQASD